jgi:hypothetical protein
MIRLAAIHQPANFGEYFTKHSCPICHSIPSPTSTPQPPAIASAATIGAGSFTTGTDSSNLGYPPMFNSFFGSKGLVLVLGIWFLKKKGQFL